MALGRKMKIFGGILTFVGLILVTVSFVSPGWINVTIKESSYDVQSIKRIVETYFSAGLWYFSICKHYSLPSYVVDLNTGQFRSLFSSPQDACEVDTYTNSLVTPITEIFLTVNAIWVLEIRILSSVGLFCSVLGFIGTIVFIRREGKSRCAGILACISLSVSGGTYVSALVKTATATLFNKEMISILNGLNSESNLFEEIEYNCPWGLVVGGIGSLLILISAIGHLCVLSRNTTESILQIHRVYTGTKEEGTASQHSFTVIAPPEYHSAVGLKVP
uniref:Uncharacterized protein LOC111118624 n=1 Tax=Crassostrea virginica TaxID=6565 RepID=A0A8B8CFC2_CRAVI|nr:uncharacterized protein LOC111118624 [Crassostrea virginica]XP_022313904.1 uncharacterized protein LOC111118637 [Crassostrea virginica]